MFSMHPYIPILANNISERVDHDNFITNNYENDNFLQNFLEFSLKSWKNRSILNDYIEYR